jgi:hypothetical protein
MTRNNQESKAFAYLAATKQLHDQVEVLLILEDTVHLDYVGVVDLLHDVDLGLQTYEVLLRQLPSTLEMRYVHNCAILL